MRSYVDKYLQHTELYLDARRFASIPPYARENKNARATSSYNRWLHLPGDVPSAARCQNFDRQDMPYVWREEVENYQWCVNNLLLDLYLLHSDPQSEVPPGKHNLFGLMCFKPPYDQLNWLPNRTYWNDMIGPDCYF